MYVGKTLFAQIMDFLPWKRFYRIVARRGGDHYVKHFSCAEQFRVMAFAQLTYRQSLRDIELCLGAQATKLYHMGLSAPVKRTTLAEANERRDWRIFAELAQCLIDEARGLYRDESFGFDLAGSVYAFDASAIGLCLSLFPWAHFGRAKSSRASVKLHTLLDLRANIPSFIHLSTGRMADVRGFEAAFAHQEVLRHHRERSEDANLDRDFGVRAHRDHQETPKSCAITVQLAAGSLAHVVRKNYIARGAATGYDTRK